MVQDNDFEAIVLITLAAMIVFLWKLRKADDFQISTKGTRHKQIYASVLVANIFRNTALFDSIVWRQ